MGRLRILTPGIGPAVLELPADVATLGRREDNSLCVPDGSVSGRHCQLGEADGVLTILDLGSTNGTFIKGEGVEQGAVAAGESFKLGGVEFCYEADAPAASPAPVVSAPPPAAPATPGGAKPPGFALKFTLGDHKPAAPAAVEPVAAPAPVSAPKPGGPKIVPTSGPSKLSLGGGHKPAPAPVESASAPMVAATATPPPPAARGGKACKRHPANAAQYVCKKCRELSCDVCSPPTEISGKTQHFCPVCKNMCLTLEAKAALDSRSLTREGQTFRQRLPGVFKYPFHKNGVWFLVIGTIVFVALDFASRFSLWITIAGIGYLFAYMQKIVRSSAEAEDELPGFPEVGEWRSELLQPFLLLAWTFVVSFGPAFGYMMYHTFADTEMSLPVLFPLFALGFLYFPMALLAVAMSSSYLAVNPLVVLPAITRLNLEYVGATTVFFGLVLARYLSETLVRAVVPVPVLPTLIGGFLALYFLACEMRLLGLIYYEHRKKLGWFSH